MSNFAFALASRNGEAEKVKFHLQNPRIDVNKYHHTLWGTALTLAARNCHEEVVKILLQNPAIGKENTTS